MGLQSNDKEIYVYMKNYKARYRKDEKFFFIFDVDDEEEKRRVMWNIYKNITKLVCRCYYFVIAILLNRILMKLY